MRHLRNGKAATLIQSSWRGYRALTDYACLIYGIISLQANFRQNRAMIDYTRRRYLRNDKAATLSKALGTVSGCLQIMPVIYGVISLHANFRQRHAMIEYTKQRHLLEVNNSADRIH